MPNLQILILNIGFVAAARGMHNPLSLLYPITYRATFASIKLRSITKIGTKFDLVSGKHDTVPGMMSDRESFCDMA